MNEENFPITDTEELNVPRLTGVSTAAMLFFVLLLALSLAGSKKEDRKPAVAAVLATGNTKPVTQFSSFPELSAHAYMVKLFGDEKPISFRREWKPMPPASLTKLMSALIAMEKLSQNEWYPVSLEARNVVEKRSHVRAGEALVRDDLIRLALVSSANDAARALAESVGRQEGAWSFPEALTAFVRIMNERAVMLGLAHTNFENPSGLDADSQFSTAEDLARLSEYIWKNKKEIWGMTREKQIALTSDASHEYDTESTNELLDEFPALLGGKTGFTEKARENLILLYPVSDRRTAVIVILGSENRFGDGRAAIRWLEENFK